MSNMQLERERALKYKELHFVYLANRIERGEQWDDSSFIYQGFPLLTRVEALNIFNYILETKDLESLGAKIDKDLPKTEGCTPSQLKKLMDVQSRRTVLNYFVTKGGSLAIEVKRKSKLFPYARYFYGRRGGNTSYQFFKNYDYTSMVPVDQHLEFDVQNNCYIN
jgi:hypothetical protein